MRFSLTNIGKILVTLISLMTLIILNRGCSVTEPEQSDDLPLPEYDTEWILIPAGKYTWGEGDTIRKINYPYWIMKYDVTNAQYLQFLEAAYDSGIIEIKESFVTGYYPGDERTAGGYYPYYSLGDSIGYRHLGRIDFQEGEFIINDEDYLTHPVVHVTYFGAEAFARFYGLQLPTEEEWEKAARGKTGYNYPWGEQFSGQNCNFYKSRDPWDNGTTPVGYFNGENNTVDSPSPYGLYDMAGNVWQWTTSFYLNTSERIVRGGCWFKSRLDSWYKESRPPDFQDNTLGFRCVYRD